MSSILKSAVSMPTALLFIDIQVGLNTLHGFYGTERSTPNFEQNVADLLKAAREYNNDVHKIKHDSGSHKMIFIVHVYHRSTNPESPLHPSSEGSEIMPCAAPVEGEIVISKQTNSAFINTPLEKMLREKGIRQLIICGIATDHCVSTSTRMAKDLGVVDIKGSNGDLDHGVVAIIQDATATFNRGQIDAETVHAVNIASLAGEFAEVVRTNEVLRYINSNNIC